MAARAGFNFKVRLNSNIYYAKDCRVHLTGADLNVSNSEGIQGGSGLSYNTLGWMARICGLRDVEFTITQATFDDNNNPFSNPISLHVGQYVGVVVWLNGINLQGWAVDNALVLDVDNANDVNGLEVVTLTAKGDTPRIAYPSSSQNASSPTAQ